MNIMTRDKALLEVFRRGLELCGQRHTQTMLGDRTTYIGMSDIGRYAECPRATVAGKFLPPETSLEHLLALQRGHWFEAGVGHALESLGLYALPQLEISIHHKGIPLRVHLDFTLVWEKPGPAIRILEVKSTDHLPDSPRHSHLIQAKGQVSLLNAFWGKPVFSLRSPDGTLAYDRLTFPQVCRKHLGVKLPVKPDTISVESWILYLSMRNVAAFGPYTCSADFMDEIFGYAVDCWRDLQAVQENPLALNNIPHAQGFYPLCICCRFNADCPKFPHGDFQPQWQPALARLDSLKQKRLSLDTEIREIENALKQAHTLSGTSDWINTGQYRFRNATTAGRRTLDKEALRGELTEIFHRANLDNIDVDAFLKRCEREGTASSRLTITPVN